MNIESYQTSKGKTKYIAHQAYIGIDSLTGKQIRKDVRANTKKDVKLKIDRIKNEFNKNGRVDRKKNFELFSEVAESWFIQYKLGVKPRSLEIMRACLDTYVLPAFGSYRIENINSIIIQQQVNQWALTATTPLNGASHRKKGKGRDYKRYFTTLNRIFKFAISLGIVTKNPCLNVQLPNVRLESTKKEIMFYNRDQRQAFFGYLDQLPNKFYDQLFKSLCRLLVATGLRVGEAMALSWADIDFKKGTLSVSKTMHIREIQDSPKTSSSQRTIFLDQQTITMLKKWWSFEQTHFLKIGKPNQKLVFPNLDGTPKDYQNLRILLYKCVKEAKVPNIGFHGLRHTHVSMLLKAGVNFKEIQHRLGHATLSMTMDTYGHLEPEQERGVINLFENVVDF